MNWYVQEPKVLKVLQDYFSEVDEAPLAEAAKSIVSESDFAKSFSRLDRSVRDPSKEKEAFQKAIGNLKRAAEHLEQIGWYGSVPLFDEAEVLAKKLNEGSIRLSVAKLDSGAFFAEHLRGVATQISNARAKVPSNPPPLWGSFDDDVKSSNKTNDQAIYIARKAAEIYATFAGSEPTISVGQEPSKYSQTAKAYGPFLNLVGDVFECLEIRASAEHYARMAIARRKALKKSMQPPLE